jgi:hypothetical protein
MCSRRFILDELRGGSLKVSITTIIVSLAATIGATASTPSAEAIRLGQELAKSGEIASLFGNFIEEQDFKRLLDQVEDLPQIDRAKLENIAFDEARHMRASYFERTGNIYAQSLSIQDLRDLVAASNSPAAGRFRKIASETMLDTAPKIDSQQWRSRVKARFCNETGKLCEVSSPPKVDTR